MSYFKIKSNYACVFQMNIVLVTHNKKKIKIACKVTQAMLGTEKPAIIDFFIEYLFRVYLLLLQSHYFVGSI